MNTGFVSAFSMALILTACASTSDGKQVVADDSEDKVYVTGSHIARKSTDNSGVQNVTGQQVTDMQRSFVGGVPAGNGNR